MVEALAMQAGNQNMCICMGSGLHGGGSVRKREAERLPQESGGHGKEEKTIKRRKWDARCENPCFRRSCKGKACTQLDRLFLKS